MGKSREVFDTVIVGAGPAGLSAALVLGRACRKVLLCDNDTPRNWASKAIYGFLTRDGTAPADFRQAADLELRRYPNISRANAEVSDAKKLPDGTFEVRLARGTVRSRKILIATGVVDQLPAIAGIESFFGTSVFQCPYCDGWELRRAPVAVYGKAQSALEIARSLTGWTDDIALCTHGRARLSERDRLGLHRNNIRIFEQPITALRGVQGKLDAIEFADGVTLERSALFFDTACTGRSKLAVSLGCQFNRRGGIRCGQYEATSVAGVFVAGNVIKDVQLSIVAAGEGARAAFGINRALTREDFDRRAWGALHIEHPSMAPSPTQQPQVHRTRAG
jgi:thioredoxin reductase